MIRRAWNLADAIKDALFDILNPDRVAARTYRAWYLLCREGMERDGGPECDRVLRHIGQRTSKREPFEREFWGDLP